MTWIQTYTGKQFWPLEPRVKDVCIEDIAHALSMKCRFNGHCQRFYSVAQHSVLVSRLCRPEDALWGLLHDAAEAYMPDIAAPIKHVFDDVVRMEHRIYEVIAEKWGLSIDMPESVRRADRVALATEKRDVMGDAPAPWTQLIDVEPSDIDITPLCPSDAKAMFVLRYLDF